MVRCAGRRPVLRAFFLSGESPERRGVLTSRHRCERLTSASLPQAMFQRRPPLPAALVLRGLQRVRRVLQHGAERHQWPLVLAQLWGGGKRAQIPMRDHSQACFSRVIMLVFISLQILLAALAGLLAFLSLPSMFFRPLPFLSPCCCHACHAGTGTSPVAMLAFERWCCVVWAPGVRGWLGDA